MTIALIGTGGFFTRAGLFAGGVNEINTFRGTTVGTTRVNNIRAQFNSADQFLVDALYAQAGSSTASGSLQPGSYIGAHGTVLNYYSGVVSAIMIQMAQDSSPLTTGQLAEALNVLIAQMKGSADSIQQNTVSVTSTAGTNTGDGTVAASVVAADGNKLENVFAETMQATVTADSFTGGATLGAETLLVKGIVGPSDPLAWNFATAGYGSNASTSINAIDATTGPSVSGNILNNSDFENFTSNLPNQWTLVAGVAGVDILKETGSPYSGLADLKFLGDGATLSGIQQQFNNAAGTVISVLPRQVLGFSLRVKIGSSAPAAGKLRISLVNGSGTVITNDASVNQQFDIDLTVATTSYVAYSSFFQLPSILPTSGVFFRVQLATGNAITNGKFVQIDHLACCVAQQMYNAAPLNNIAGGPYVAAFSGATAFVVNDTFNVAVSNNYGGKFQTALWKFFNTPSLGVRVPSSGAPTVSDALVT